MSKQTEKDPSNQDILTAINGFADEIEQRFATKDDLLVFATKKDFKTLEDKITALDDKLVTRLDRILVNTERLETERIAHQDWLQRHDQLFKKLLPQG